MTCILANDLAVARVSHQSFPLFVRGMSSTIVEASVQHLDLLVPLFERYRSFYRMPQATDSARLFLKRRIEAEESVVLMALNDEGRATGFVQLYPSFSSVRLCRHWILNDLFVAEPFRGQGIGGALVAAAVERVRQSGSASLELATEKTNGPARRLYESLGWRLNNEFDHYVFIDHLCASATVDR